MGIGFFRKLKDFGKKVCGKIKEIIPKALPVLGEIIPRVFPAAALFIKLATDIITHLVSNKAAATAPKPMIANMKNPFTTPSIDSGDDVDDYDKDNEYMKLKTGI